MPKFSIFTKLVIGAVCALFLLLGLSAFLRGDYPVAIGSGLILVVIGSLAWIGIRSMRYAQGLSQLAPERRRRAIKSQARWVAVLGLITVVLKIVAMRAHH